VGGKLPRLGLTRGQGACGFVLGRPRTAHLIQRERGAAREGLNTVVAAKPTGTLLVTVAQPSGLENWAGPRASVCVA
jgi:hypothetical protein